MRPAPCGRDGRPLWTEDDVREAADLDNPPSPQIVAKVMSIVRAALVRQIGRGAPAA
jgi:hypothetical protein